ncbi:MAG TPA: AI-2E family transporter [Stellaceae bacterium]|nr:AI-2E family transporter [Stellaceae bacterium]
MADRLPSTNDNDTGPARTAGPSLSASLSVLTASVIIAALYFAREILVPIALAVLLSFLLAPVVRRLRRIGAGRIVAVGVTVLVAFVAIFGFAAVLVREASSLAPQLPDYRSNIEAKIRTLPQIAGGGLIQRASMMLHQLHNELLRSESRLSTPAGLPANSSPSPVEPAKPLPVEIRQPEPSPLEIAQSVVGPLLQPLAMAGLIVVLVILILLDREDLRDRLLRLAGVGDLHRTTEAMDDAAQRVSRYLLMQLAVNAAAGLLIGCGLTVIGVPNPALWGILVVLFRFIPFLGIVIAACFPLALAIAVDPGWALVVWTAVLFVGTEVIIANLVEPYLLGDSAGLSATAVIIAAIFWTWLWGPIGLLLSTPLTACLVVLGRHVPQVHFLNVLFGNEPALAPEETLYQRMLANDPEEAAEQAEEFAKERSLTEFFDTVAIPGLMRAQADSDRGLLSGDRRARLKEAFSTMLENLHDDNQPEEVGPTAQPEGAGPNRTVICIAGRNELDEAAALMLAHLLHPRGFAVRVFPADALAPDGGARFGSTDAAIICLSLLSTGAPARARYLVRRARKRAPGARLILGFWALDTQQLPPANVAADVVAMSLGKAVDDIEADVSVGVSPAPSLVPAACG